MLRRIAILLPFLLISAWALAAVGQVETIGPMTSAPAGFEKVLDRKGYRVTISAGPSADIWFRAKLEAGKANDAEDAVYPQLAPGEFLGVIRLASPAIDFRGQSVKPGTYTMRYQLLPSDGNHMGMAPNPDFVLLLPIADDPDPDIGMAESRLIQLSSQVTPGKHPAVFLLASPEVSAYPAVVQTPDGYVAFAVKVSASSGDIPVAVILKGTAQ
jgi:hypothetical protein